MINTAAVIGAGTMGYGIAFQFAVHGKKVYLIDQSQDILAQAKEKIQKYTEIFSEEGYKPIPSAEEVLSNIIFTDKLEDAREADFVTECVTENLPLKQKLFLQMEQTFDKNTIFASNTSSLTLEDILVHVSENRHRCLLTHWFNPAHLVPLVEMLKLEETDPQVYEQVKEFLHEVGKVTIDVKKGVPGLVANRIQTAMAREVLTLLEDGVATEEDIDKAVRYGPGFRLSLSGLLEIMDFGGLDVWQKVIEQLQPQIASHQKPYEIVNQKVADGKLGLKSGGGFYEYPNKSFDDYIFNRDRSLLRQLLSNQTDKQS